MMTAKNTSKKPVSSGLLDGIGDLSALLNTPPAAANNGGPPMLDMSLIDEDPDQPRSKDNPGFLPESMKEFAAAIQLRGVKTPISVRDNLENPGRFIINHGARRFRASRLAGMDTIPGFIDNNYNNADQVVENIQRDGLTAREIADYIGRELAKGLMKIEIAKAISKSQAFVTQHATLLDLPDPVAITFNNGRAKDVTVVNELVYLFKKDAETVTDWLADKTQDITRTTVKELREYILKNKEDDKNWSVQQFVTPPPAGTIDQDGGGDTDDVISEKRSDAVDSTHEDDQNNTDIHGDAFGSTGSMETVPPENTNTTTDNASNEKVAGVVEKSEKLSDPSKFKKAIVQIWHDGRPARLILDKRPSSEGFAHIKYDEDGHEIEADLGDVKLIAVLEG